MERTNIRYVTPEDLGEPLDLSVIDVSFIGLEIVLPTIKNLLKPTGQVLCLIKPQFEAGKENVGKKGVVREPKIHQMVLDNFVSLVKRLGFNILGLTFSPVKGPEGNIEFLAHLSLDAVEGIRPDTALVVEQAHKTLDGGNNG
jgi:23S rRNA (cytidine1920-2'-O)/16S rRNA (cytidine1409-2'-O)-methyltransferase